MEGNCGNLEGKSDQDKENAKKVAVVMNAYELPDGKTILPALRREGEEEGGYRACSKPTIRAIEVKNTPPPCYRSGNNKGGVFLIKCHFTKKSLYRAPDRGITRGYSYKGGYS